MEKAEEGGKHSLKEAIGRLDIFLPPPGTRAQQREEADDCATLFADAAKVKAAFDIVVEELAAAHPSLKLTVEKTDELGPNGRPLSGLKRSSRIVEKVRHRPWACPPPCPAES